MISLKKDFAPAADPRQGLRTPTQSYLLEAHKLKTLRASCIVDTFEAEMRGEHSGKRHFLFQDDDLASVDPLTPEKCPSDNAPANEGQDAATENSEDGCYSDDEGSAANVVQ